MMMLLKVFAGSLLTVVAPLYGMKSKKKQRPLDPKYVIMSGEGAYPKPYTLTNDLFSFAQRDLKQMEAIGSNDKISIVVALDLHKKVTSFTVQSSLSQESSETSSTKGPTQESKE